MANLEYSPKLPYTLVPNTLPDSAGYHYAVSHIGSRSGDAIFKSVADKLPGQTAAGVELVWESLIAAVRESLMEHLYRVSVNGVAFELAIPGSTTSINGMPTEGAYVSITPSATLRSATAGMTPVYSAGEEDVPSVKRVENLAAHKNGEIVDAEVFRIAGNNITAAGDDESLKAVAANGTEAFAEVTGEDGYGMFITARLSTALPPGKGKVVLTTHGKRTPEGELRTLVKSVAILAGDPEPSDPPVATGYVADEMEGEPINVSSSTVVVSGTNLADATKVRFSYTEDGAAFYEADVTAATETSATVAMDYHQVPSSQHGYLRVVGPGGVSNALACSYAE